jgi:MerR family copper efflux transcriptional regulator
MLGDAQERATFSIGEVARRFGVAVSTLRWWEKQGLLVPSCRESGRRRYDAAAVRRIALIQLLQQTALMSLDEIRTVLSDGRSGAWRETVRARLAVCDEQLVRLQAAQAYLSHALRCRRDDPVGGCPRLAEEIDSWLESATPQAVSAS